MSKAHDHRTPAQDASSKVRFDLLRLHRIKGRSHLLTSPFHGKNRAQRQRLSAGFAARTNGRPNGRW